jgi:hypothetical protein
MDRFFLWESSQMRRRDLLEAAGVATRREGVRSWKAHARLRSLFPRRRGGRPAASDPKRPLDEPGAQSHPTPNRQPWVGRRPGQAFRPHP